MFKDWYQITLKQTGKDEKKQVIKDSMDGGYMPEESDNKIKGMDNVVEKTIETMKKEQEEYMEKNSNNTTKTNNSFMVRQCAVCGKSFNSYRGIAKYCCKKCKNEAVAKQHSDYDKKRRGKKANAVEKPVENTVENIIPTVDEITIMQMAVDIVRSIKQVEDVKMCIDTVYDILYKNIRRN